MKEQEVLSAVRVSAGLNEDEQAERAVEATLLVLGDRLAGDETGDLASQLPLTLADALPDQGLGEVFDLDEFYRRVADNEAVDDVRIARRHARAVLAVIKESVRPDRFQYLTRRLPADYDDLLSARPAWPGTRRTGWTGVRT